MPSAGPGTQQAVRVDFEGAPTYHMGVRNVLLPAENPKFLRSLTV